MRYQHSNTLNIDLILKQFTLWIDLHIYSKYINFTAHQLLQGFFFKLKCGISPVVSAYKLTLANVQAKLSKPTN